MRRIPGFVLIHREPGLTKTLGDFAISSVRQEFESQSKVEISRSGMNFGALGQTLLGDQQTWHQAANNNHGILHEVSQYRRDVEKT